MNVTGTVTWKKLAASLFRILAGVPLVSLFVVGMLFLCLGETLKGRSVGLSAVVLSGVVWLVIGFWNRSWFRALRVGFLALLVPSALLLYGVPMLSAPSGHPPNGQFRNCFLHGKGYVCRLAPWNVIPEVDQLKVASYLLPLRDPHADFARAARLRSLMITMCRDMEADADFRTLGSALGAAYGELFHLEFRTGHYYVCLPPTNAADGEKLPCLIFLHGMGGNSKPYLWVLSRLARQARCVVIAPTFGMGNWNKEGGAEFVADVAREALATLPVDPRKLFLMGYSNGGMGVTRAAVRDPGLFQGLIYLSPVTEDDVFATRAFAASARGRRILFLSGGCDERIPRRLVTATAASLKQMGCNVQAKIYEREDHFLLFAQPQAVLDAIMEFMNAADGAHP